MPRKKRRRGNSTKGKRLHCTPEHSYFRGRLDVQDSTWSQSLAQEPNPVPESLSRTSATKIGKRLQVAQRSDMAKSASGIEVVFFRSRVKIAPIDASTHSIDVSRPPRVACQSICPRFSSKCVM